MYVFIIPYCLALCGSRLCLFTTELHLVKKRLPPSKAMSKETVTEVPNVKKDDTGRQDPLTVGKSHKITGTMSPSQGMPQGQALPTSLCELSESWWKTSVILWPDFRKLSPEEHKAQSPPCWLGTVQGKVTIHEPRDWHKCDLCRVEFMRQNGRFCPPSKWICRCGNHNLLWFHNERPHVDEHCRPCNGGHEGGWH